MSLGKVEDGLKAGNFDAKYIVVPFTFPNVEYRINHGLSRTPVSVVQVNDLKIGKVGVRIDVTRDATSQSLWMKSEEVGPVAFLIW